MRLAAAPSRPLKFLRRHFLHTTPYVITLRLLLQHACRIATDADHDLVELFARRSFQCDCPTSYPSSSPSPTSTAAVTTTTPCSLHPSNSQPLPHATNNIYTRNFRGEFCRCERGKRYDPVTETESMVCCIGCEDWFHEGCLVSCVRLINIFMVDCAVSSSENNDGLGIRCEKARRESSIDRAEPNVVHRADVRPLNQCPPHFLGPAHPFLSCRRIHHRPHHTPIRSFLRDRICKILHPYLSRQAVNHHYRRRCRQREERPPLELEGVVVRPQELRRPIHFWTITPPADHSSCRQRCQRQRREEEEEDPERPVRALKGKARMEALLLLSVSGTPPSKPTRPRRLATKKEKTTMTMTMTNPRSCLHQLTSISSVDPVCLEASICGLRRGMKGG